jgi:hypothetical protein
MIPHEQRGEQRARRLMTSFSIGMRVKQPVRTGKKGLHHIVMMNRKDYTRDEKP